MAKSAKWDNADEEKPTMRFYFLGLKAVKEGGQTGENLFRLLSELKAERDVPPSKAVCIVTDRASNMTSKDVGLATRVVQASLGAIPGICFMCNTLHMLNNLPFCIYLSFFFFFSFVSFFFFACTFLFQCISHGGNLAGGDTVKALVVFNNAKKTTQNVRVFVMQPGRLVAYTNECEKLHLHAYVLIDQARTRFLAMVTLRFINSSSSLHQSEPFALSCGTPLTRRFGRVGTRYSAALPPSPTSSASLSKQWWLTRST
jgi:hypothetical protein